MNSADTVVVPAAAIVCNVSAVGLRIAYRVERLLGHENDLEIVR